MKNTNNNQPGDVWPAAGHLAFATAAGSTIGPRAWS